LRLAQGSEVRTKARGDDICLEMGGIADIMHAEREFDTL